MGAAPQSYHILVVDDTAAMQRALAGLLVLQYPSSTIATVSNDDQLLRTATQRHIDLIIMHLTLPDGLARISALHAQRPSIPLLVTTTKRDAADEALAAGAIQVLVQPFTAQQLLAVLELLLPS
jgi:DNA-binding NarL/FixJ family response regulator